MIRLHAYWRSSASWRVRIVMRWKGLAYEVVPVHLVREGGEQNHAAYRALNPAGLLPALEIDGLVLTESMPIVEYLEETYKRPSMLPDDPKDRAHVRRLCETVNAGIQPLQNLRVLQRLGNELGAEKPDVRAWARHFITIGFDALEPLLAESAGTYCFGDQVTFADAFLVPQIYNARRFDVDLTAYPTIVRIDEACARLDAFKAAHADAQPDRPENPTP